MMDGMKVKLDERAFMPERAYATDAGLDLKSPMTLEVPPGGAISINTGVHIELPEHTAGLLVSKSGLNTKYDITTTGLIDEGYSGEICVRVRNHGKVRYVIHRGDKISQLVIIPVVHVNCYESKEISSGERGKNGFGSSGR